MRRLAFLISLAALLLLPASAGAEGSGTIDGVLAEKTPGASLQAGAKATLYLVAQNQDPKAQGTVDVPASGQFSFSSLATEPTDTYQVLVEYGGGRYVSDKLGFAAGQTQTKVAIGVYEPTVDDTVVSLDATSLVLTTPDAANHELTILELDAFNNSSQRTFVPSATPRGGKPPNLLRFSLPPNSHDLQPGTGMAPQDVIQIDQGFGALTPLLPGSQDLGFTFQTPYQTSELTFSTSILYPTKTFRVLVPAGNPRVSSPQLKSQGTRTIGSQTYEMLVGENLQHGDRVVLTLSALPGISPLAFLSQPNTLRWLALLLALVILGLLGWYFYDRTRNRRAAEAAGPQPDSASMTRRDLEKERRDLLIAMARLDDRYEAGNISPDDYRLQREAHKSELKQLMKELEALQV